MILNLTKKTILSEKPVFANGFIIRLRGMIGRRFDHFDAMIFPECSTVHTFFMNIPLDLIFVGADNKVKMVRNHVKPWCPVIGCREANIVIELASGTTEKSGTQEGDILDMTGEIDKEQSNIFDMNHNQYAAKEQYSCRTGGYFS